MLGAPITSTVRHNVFATSEAVATLRARLRIRTAARLDAWSAGGGGEVQMAATTRELHRLGIDARPWRPWDADELQAGDVVHFFGSRPEFVEPAEALKTRDVRVVVSTIAWFDWRNTLREPTSLVRRSCDLARYAMRAALPRLPSWRRRLYQAADLLLPNSLAEAEQLIRLFQMPRAKVRIVPNGVDPRFAAADARQFQACYGHDPFVLCPGRIEPRKNQLALIRALHGKGIRLVLLGDVVTGHERYAAACRAAADDLVLFIGGVRHDDPLLASAYAACRCVALTSWYETPSLAALEAALCGTPLVLPSGGSAREYFGPLARYVAPHDLAEIHAAVSAAAAESRSSRLANLVSGQFTWQHVAEATWAAYDAL